MSHTSKPLQQAPAVPDSSSSAVPPDFESDGSPLGNHLKLAIERDGAIYCTYDPKDVHKIDEAGFFSDDNGKFWCQVHHIHRLTDEIAALRDKLEQPMKCGHPKRLEDIGADGKPFCWKCQAIDNFTSGQMEIIALTQKLAEAEP